MSFEILEPVHAPLRTPIDGDRDYADNTLSGVDLVTPLVVVGLLVAFTLWAMHTSAEDLDDEFYG